MLKLVFSSARSVTLSGSARRLAARAGQCLEALARNALSVAIVAGSPSWRSRGGASHGRARGERELRSLAAARSVRYAKAASNKRRWRLAASRRFVIAVSPNGRIQ